MNSPHTRRRTRTILVSLALALASVGLAATAQAWELAGSKTTFAHTNDQQRLTVGTVLFEPQSDGRIRFTVTMAHQGFRDHFLSMKEFKCLEGPTELACHVPYPYPQPGTVQGNDFAWLEHQLLFLYKLPKEFGAKLWNGLYFKLERGERGLVGKPQAIDLNYISAPPDRPNVPPYRPALRDDIVPGARWISGLTIE